MKGSWIRRSSQIVFLQRAGQHSQLIRTYSLPVSFDMRRQNSMRRRQGKEGGSASDQRICTKDNCLSCCKKFTAFMFSRVGLFFVMIGYVALGGLIFQALEAGNERNMRLIMDAELNSTVSKIWDEVLRVIRFPPEEKRGNFSRNAASELGKFEETVIRQVRQGFDGRSKNAENDWNYFGAVLYAVTLVSTIGYGHITTKTNPGKIATILYSAFGVPLMMLFVANIGSTMAKSFAFVFTRITRLLCCRISAKKKRLTAMKNRQKNFDKLSATSTTVVIDEKSPMPTKTTLTPIEDKPESSIVSSQSQNDLRQLPANIRLNMLTNANTSSTNSLGERSKDAIVRINELIRQSSVQEFEENDRSELEESPRQRRRSAEVSPIEYYINETKKLTSNLDSPMHSKASAPIEPVEPVIHPKETATTIVDTEDQQHKMTEEEQPKKSSKKILKRSKSESSHNRRGGEEEKDSKPTRRRFFSRRQTKLKKQMTIGNESIEVKEKHPGLQRKYQSFHEHSSPPPAYEQSTTNEITPVQNTVTWKSEDQFYSAKTTFDLTHPDLENGDPLNDDDYDDDDDEEMSVPLLVTVFVIPLYLTLGAILFNIWEKWGFLNSFYFCFITLTTIGFGDFVPGSALNVAAEKEKLISAAFYILLGLVLIAMCVNLMKEQLSQKVKRVASKLGNF